MTRPSGFFFLALAEALVFFAPFLAGTAALFAFYFVGFTGVAGLAVSALAIVVGLAFSTFLAGAAGLAFSAFTLVAGFVAGFSVGLVSASTPVGSIK